MFKPLNFSNDKSAWNPLCFGHIILLYIFFRRITIDLILIVWEHTQNDTFGQDYIMTVSIQNIFHLPGSLSFLSFSFLNFIFQHTFSHLIFVTLEKKKQKNFCEWYNVDEIESFKMVFEFRILFLAKFLLWSVQQKKEEERMYKSYDETDRDLKKKIK